MVENEKEKTESEIEHDRAEMETGIKKRETEAKEKLDSLFSKKNMEFCSRCNKKISSRTDWAGKCLYENCEKLLCRECWDVNKFRSCKEHSKAAIGEHNKTEPAREEGFEKDLKIDLGSMLDGHDESRLEKLKYYTSEYVRWLKRRMEKNGSIDWTPTHFIKKPIMDFEKTETESVIKILEKGWFRKKMKLSIIISSMDTRGEVDFNYINAFLQKLSRKTSNYKLFIMVADGARHDVVNFFNAFTDSKFSLFLVEPKKGNLYFNVTEPLTFSYSGWLNQKREPYVFKERLKKLSDLVSGRLIVSENSVEKDFGFDPKEVNGILGSVPFLKEIKGTGKFVWKDDD